jgi:hypothetical protein
MHQDWLHRLRTTVKIHSGETSLIGKTRQGRVGLLSKRYQGCALNEGEIWLVDVVHEYPKFFIMIPIEKIKDATEATQNSTISD